MAPLVYSLIVVSNRLPFVIRTDNEGAVRVPTAGGLATAVGPVLLKSKGIWVGYIGIVGGFEGGIPDRRTEDELPSEQILPINLTKDEVEKYYDTISNGLLWPVFNSMPEKAEFDGAHSSWQTYVSVNQKFADKTMDEAVEQSRKKGEKAVVWIQDYHLLLTGQMLREKLGNSVVLAFFLHIPFPQYEVLARLSHAKAILEALLACDIIGFHLESDCINFNDCCKRCLGYQAEDLAKLEGRLVKCYAMPIGIPFEPFEKMALSAPMIEKNGMKIIVGADRLDYIKGIPEKLKAFERLLDKRPEHREKVQLIQAAVPSRANMGQYQLLKDEVYRLVQQINGRFGTAKWLPIVYMHRLVPQRELVEWYKSADVALILSLHDGMNLVAKEFVACQVSKPGVLVLSKFAGASESMEEALIVNPYDSEEVAEALDLALKMGEAEKTIRMHSMRAKVEREDIHTWMNSFMMAVKDHETLSEKVRISGKFYKMFDAYLRKKPGKRVTSFAILLDFDGTLCPLVSHPMLSKIPPDTQRILQKLNEKTTAYIAIISGRQVDELMDKVGINNITYSGSHGNVIRFTEGFQHISYSGSHGNVIRFTKGFQYENMPDPSLQMIKNKLEDELLRRESFAGVWVEDKGYTLTVHFNQAEKPDKELERQTIQFLDDIARVLEKQFTIMPGHLTVEVKGQGSKNKGFAVSKIIKEWLFWGNITENFGAIYIGDDTTDEDAFKILKDDGITIRVGRSSINTQAEHVLPDVIHVKRLLNWIYSNYAVIMGTTI